MGNRMRHIDKSTRLKATEMTTNGTEPALPLQSDNGKRLFIGADAVALYPSLDRVATARIAGNSVRTTRTKFGGINYVFLCIYLFLIMGTQGMKNAGLSECIPRKKGKSVAKSLSSTVNRNLDEWDLDDIKFTDSNKREMVATMVQIAVLTLTSTTCYTFNGKIFQQISGLGIGLRASAALARIVMCEWDEIWANGQKRMGLSINLFFRYIDDIRLFLTTINPGWLWEDGRWKFDQDLVDSHLHEDPLTRTLREIEKSLNGVWNFLKFTTEGENDFNTNYLPTLDFQTKVIDNGRITYKYYAKPMSNNLLLQKGTSLSKSCIFSSLRQDLVRRLINTWVEEDTQTRISIIKDFIQLMVNSGHKFSYVKAVVLQAISKFNHMKYRNSLDCENKKYMPMHRTRDYDYERRKLSKYLNSDTWFRVIQDMINLGMIGRKLLEGEE